MAKLTAQEQIAKMESQRKAIALKIQALTRKEDERLAKENSANRNRIGILAEAAGISEMTDEELKAAFSAIIKQ